MKVLLSSVRTALGTESADHLKASVQGDLKWTDLVQAAREQGVMPLLYRSLTAIGPDAAPAAIIDQLRGYFRDNILPPSCKRKATASTGRSRWTERAGWEANECSSWGCACPPIYLAQRCQLKPSR
jgi:hypothetical protein